MRTTKHWTFIAMIAKWSCQIIGKRETRKKISNFAVNKQPLLKARFLFLLFACTFPALIKAEETSDVKSPDKAYVISWVDRSVSGDPANEKRIITLKTVQDGRVLFSFTTQPRDTRAFWSSDSKKCFFWMDQMMAMLTLGFFSWETYAQSRM